MASTLVCDGTIHTIVFFGWVLADERSEQAKFKRAERAALQAWRRHAVLAAGGEFFRYKRKRESFPPVLRFGRPDPCDDIV